MRVIVTGGAGFIGSHLVDKLLEDKKIKKFIILDILTSGKRNISHLLKNKKLVVYKKDVRKIEPNDKLFKNVDCVFIWLHWLILFPLLSIQENIMKPM